ncbi:hypothetical protein FQN49_003945 [Arthroderma sp. PD_2]|nr:hypothetical protein FQN49_003945 [Arthroderma sp. PD_2]
MAVTKQANTEQKDGTGKRSPCRDVFLFSHARTASNLLCRLLSDQPGFMQSEYHFQPAFLFARKSFDWGPLTDITDEQRREFDELHQEGMNNLQKARDAAIAENKRLFVKNHTFHVWEPSSLSQSMWGGTPASPFTARTGPDASTIRTNPTLFPDEFLTSWQPVFLVRHPALAFESWYRAEIRVEPIDILSKSWSYLTTFQYSRQLYDWLVANGHNDTSEKENGSGARKNPLPIVLDADDIIDGESMAKLCKICDMDPECIRYKWEKSVPADSATLGARQLSYMGGIWGSTSIDKSKSSRGLNMEAKYDSWKEEFGITAADQLCKRVRDAMPDYEYLKSKKI